MTRSHKINLNLMYATNALTSGTVSVDDKTMDFVYSRDNLILSDESTDPEVKAQIKEEIDDLYRVTKKAVGI